MRTSILILLVIVCTTRISFAADAPAFALNVRDFGAVGDGNADDMGAFNKALEAAAKNGARVIVPPGKYLISGQIDIPTAVTLEGTFTAPEQSMGSAHGATKGSVLLTTAGKNDADGKPFITLHSESTVRGLIVFYPEQTPEVIPFPWCIRGEGDNCTIRDVLLINPYQAVDFGTKHCGRHFISGLYGQPLKTGILVDKCFDVGRIENVHFWPFWMDDKKLEKWTSENGTAFIIGRSDWEYMRDCFCIFYHVGYHFVGNQDGPGNAILTQCGSDIGPCSVKVDATQGHAGVSFSNSQFMCGVEVGEHNSGPVKFTSCGFWGVQHVTSHAAEIRGSGNVTFTACHFTGWGQADDPAAPCILAHSGGLTVNGCEFLDGDEKKTHVMLEKDVDTAIITASRFHAPPKIINQSGGDVSIGQNVTTKRQAK